MKQNWVVYALAFLGLATLLSFQNCGDGLRSSGLYAGGSSNFNPGSAIDEPAQVTPEDVVLNVDDFVPTAEMPVATEIPEQGCQFAQQDYYTQPVTDPKPPYSLQDTVWGKKVFYSYQWVFDADPTTFTALNRNFGKDKDFLYAGANVVLALNGNEQFLAHPENTRYLLIPNRKLVVDSIYGLLNVDYDSFEVLGTMGYRDQFHADERIRIKGFWPGGNAQILGGSFVRDGNSIYYASQKIEVANPTNFQVIQNYPALARDGVNLYYGKKTLFPDDGSPITIRKTQTSGDFWIYRGKLYTGEYEIGDVNQARDLGAGWFAVNGQIKRGGLESQWKHPDSDWDPLSFQVLNGVWARDHSKLIRYGYRFVDIPDANNQFQSSVPGFKIDQVYGSFLSIKGYPYYASLGPNQNIQVSGPQDITCLGNYTLIKNRIFLYDLSELTQDWTSQGANLANLKLYPGSYTVLYDNNGVANGNSQYIPFTGNTFTPISPTFYHDGQRFRSIRFDPNSTNTAPLALLVAPLNSLIAASNDELVLQNVYVNGTDVAARAADTSYVREMIPDRRGYGSFVFADGHGGSGPTTRLADPTTLQWITDTLYKDSVNVYNRNNIVAGLSPSTTNIYNYGGSGYWFAGQQVYYQNTLVTGVTPANVQLLSLIYPFRRNGTNVRCNESQNVSTDANNFRFIGEDEMLWRDLSQMGYTCTIYNGINPDTAQFYYLGSNTYSPLVRGTSSAFFGITNLSSLVNFSNPWTVFPSGFSDGRTSRYWTDGVSVFYQNRVLPGADIATFKVNLNSESTAQDKGQCYASSSVIPCP